MAEDWQAGGFGLYLHWPFCQAKCPYCDFNSHVAGEIDESRWTRAYIREIDRHAELVPDRVLSSVYLGGGTPSLMPPAMVDAILRRIRERWPLANDPEITLEANPGSVEADRFRAYADAGVNRVSLGIQALNNADLRRLGRLHTADEALSALKVARAHFQRVNFDLIYARQNQSLEDWRSELLQALELAADHLSLYQLTIEDGTVFGARHRAGKLPGLPHQDLAADMFELTQELCQAAGFEAYEISNHARAGQESRHNRVYWRYGDYVGIGPGAHGRLTVEGQRLATETALAPERWLSAVESGSGTLRSTRLSAREQGLEFLLMGLRLNEGVDLRRHSRLAETPLSDEPISRLEDLGLIELDGAALKVTARGRPVLNTVLAALTES